MECLNCQKEIVGKKSTARYCSIKCRVAHHRKNGKKQGITEPQMQVLYNSFLEAIRSLKGGLPATQPITPEKDFAQTHQPYSMNIPAQIVMRNYWLEKVELTADTYPQWLQRLYSDPRLTRKQKELIKNTNQHE
jgi:hypothetical protein